MTVWDGRIHAGGRVGHFGVVIAAFARAEPVSEAAYLCQRLPEVGLVGSRDDDDKCTFVVSCVSRHRELFERRDGKVILPP